MGSHQFFRTKPLACDPSSLPKYPPSKEYDAKLRGKEAMRQNATASIAGKGSLSVKPGRNEPKPMPGHDAIGEDHQRRQVRNDPKSNSHHYSTREDSVSGFRMEPRAAAGPPSTTQNAGQFGSTWYRKDDQRGRGVQRTTSSVRVSNHAAHLTSQRSYATSRGTDLHPSSSAARNTNSKYNRLDVAEPANALDRPVPTNKDTGMRDAPSAGYGGRNRRMNYSGPLVPPGGNMDEMLKEHERQIQQAVRKARVDKERTNRNHY